MSGKVSSGKGGFRLFWYLNVIAIIALFLAYLGTRVSPEIAWPLAFFSMAYPYILLANVLFIIWWVFRKTARKALFSVLAIMLGFSHLGNFIQFRPFNGPSAPENVTGIKVMSYNVRLFDLYNWTHNKQTRNRMFDLFNNEKPDLLCLQEFYKVDDRKFFVTKDTLLNSFHWKHCQDEYTQHTKKGQHFGIATFSRWPFIKSGVIRLSDEDNNICIWSDIVAHGDTMRVYNAHLASIRFGNEDYEFIKELENADEKAPLAEGGKRIIGRLRNAFRKRAKQAAKIADHMGSSPHPIVYCGDLNDTPNSYSYARIGDFLTDAFKVSGNGIGNTYVGDFPSFRIDHIMHSKDVNSWGFRTLKVEYSDHHPVSCWIAPSE